MDTLINLYAKVSGLWVTICELLPLLGAIGSILGVGSSILIRASSAPDASALLHALHPNAHELGSLSLAVGLLKAHFNHQESKAAIEKVNA